MPTVVSPQVASKLLAPLQFVLFDIDGVLWSGADVIPKAPETIQWLRSLGKQVRFLSNNASVSRAQLRDMFNRQGIPGVRLEEVYNSAYTAALRLQQMLGTSDEKTGQKFVYGNVFVIGEQGLHDELQQVLAPHFITYGVELHDPSALGGYNSHQVAAAWTQPVLPPPLKRLVLGNGSNCRVVQAGTPQNSANISLSDLNPVAVVVGLDLHFNVVKLAYASMALQGRPGTKGTIPFIATNEDPQIPVGPTKVLLPGAGAMVSSLSTAAGRAPDAVCGKPHVDMARALFTAEDINDTSVCMMVGDRLTTDVAFGNAAGCRTMLVLSGAEGVADVAAAKTLGSVHLLPDYIADSIADLMQE